MNIFEYCCDKFFLTGSRAMGVANKNSDWDFLVFQNDLDNLLARFPLLKIPEISEGSLSQLFISIKLSVEEEINLILIDTLSDYEAWVNATIKTHYDMPEKYEQRKEIFGKHLLESYTLYKDNSMKDSEKYEAALKLWGV